MENNLVYKISLEPTGTHMLLADNIVPGSKVLDVGCADGYMGEFLIKHKNCEVWGIEPFPESFTLAQNKGYVFISNNQIEIALQEEKLKNEQFDFILIGDVLEHLVFPDQVLRDLKKLLKPNGVLVVSLPNVGHYSIRRNLLMGKWDMTESGIMDRTHLHFFTLKTAVELLEKNGWKIQSMRPRGDLERWFRKIGLEKFGKKALYLFPELFSIQFVFTAKSA